jgi:hypothetical protein
MSRQMKRIIERQESFSDCWVIRMLDIQNHFLIPAVD